MKDKSFIRTLIIIALIGCMATAAHIFYICKAYTNSSIIYFVSQEIWP